MSHELHWGVALSEALYRGFVWMLPSDFRSAYGQDVRNE